MIEVLRGALQNEPGQEKPIVTFRAIDKETA
jgi:hypothetical protein